MDDIVTSIIFEKEHAEFVLKAFEFAIKQKGIDLSDNQNIEIRYIHAKLKVMVSASEYIKEIRELERQILDLNDKDSKAYKNYMNHFEK